MDEIAAYEVFDELLNLHGLFEVQVGGLFNCPECVASVTPWWVANEGGNYELFSVHTVLSAWTTPSHDGALLSG
jgi:hypothetical protein